MPVCVNMEQCLTNGANQQRLIIMFICAVHCAGYEQFGKASDDADRHQQECTPEENISADDTFMQNARNFWGMTVETTTTAGGQ